MSIFNLTCQTVEVILIMLVITINSHTQPLKAEGDIFVHAVTVARPYQCTRLRYNFPILNMWATKSLCEKA